MNEKELTQEFVRRVKAAKIVLDPVTQKSKPLCLMSGKLTSEIAIIGEAPGEQEVSIGVPFTGPSGQFLWRELRKVGVSRADCYVTNVIKRKAATLSDGSKDPIPKFELEHWEHLLNWELDQLPNLKYVIVLGGVCLGALTGEKSITKWQGSVFDCTVGHSQRVVSVTATFNPAGS